MNATPQQQAIFDFLSNNEARVKEGHKRRSLIVSALAGSGKSTTCIEAIKRLPNASIAYTMFNKQTVEQFREKSLGLTNVTIDTAHAFGNKAIKNSSKSKLDKDKVKKIVEELLRGDKKAFKLTPLVISLVNYAKDFGIGLMIDDGEAGARASNGEIFETLIERFNLECGQDEEAVIGLAWQALGTSNRDLSTHDFADMIYLPLLRNYQFERFDYVFIDEAQDTNSTKRLMYEKMLKPFGAVVVVGDRHQAIYGFTGADHDSMTLFKHKFACEELPLTTCFRCDRAIIRKAQVYVPEIMASGDASEGRVGAIKYSSCLSANMNIDFGEAKGGHLPVSISNFYESDVILCRYNAPLVKMAFALLRRGIPCRIEGRDIGWGLQKLVQKLGGADINELSSNIESYRGKESEKAKSDSRRELINDKCDMLQVLVQRARDQRWGIPGLIDSIMLMFNDANDPKTPRNVLTLSSVHKSKGREWGRVFILGRSQFMPSKYATTDAELLQETNLVYVAITRAKHELVFITEVPEK